MKNRNLIIVFSCLGAAVGLCLVFVAGIFISGNNMAFVTCYVTESGCVHMLCDGRLIALSGTGETDIESGDRAFVIFGTAFAESFPESTRALYILKTGEGKLDDIELDVELKEQYEELGFVFK